MRQPWLNPSPKSRRLLSVLIGTACAATLAASAMGTSSSGSGASADVALDGP